MLVLCQFTRVETAHAGYASNYQTIQHVVKDSIMLAVERSTDLILDFDKFARSSGHREIRFTRYTPENHQPIW